MVTTLTWIYNMYSNLHLFKKNVCWSTACVISKTTDEIEHFSNLIYIQASCPQKPLSKHNYNRGSADEHKTAFVCFVCKGTNMTIISECFERINQTGHAKTLTHQTIWCYWDWCGIQRSVRLPNAHPSFTSLHTHTHTHKLKWIQLLTTRQTYQCIEKTCDLLPPLFYIPWHSFKMSKWAFASQPHIPAKLIHSQHHAVH
jgi:hypothetical protein